MIGLCSGCGKTREIKVKSRMLCNSCRQQNNYIVRSPGKKKRVKKVCLKCNKEKLMREWQHLCKACTASNANYGPGAEGQR